MTVPSFLVEKVQYPFSGQIIDLKIQSNVMYVLLCKIRSDSTDSYELIEINLLKAAAVKVFPVQFSGSFKKIRLFPTSDGNSVLLLGHQKAFLFDRVKMNPVKIGQISVVCWMKDDSLVFTNEQGQIFKGQLVQNSLTNQTLIADFKQPISDLLIINELIHVCTTDSVLELNLESKQFKCLVSNVSTTFSKIIRNSVLDLLIWVTDTGFFILNGEKQPDFISCVHFIGESLIYSALSTDFYLIIGTKTTMYFVNLVNYSMDHESVQPSQFLLECDTKAKTFWSYSVSGISEILIKNETSNLSRLFAQIKDYSRAIQFAQSQMEKDQCLEELAISEFQKGSNASAIKHLAEITSIPFERLVFKHFMNPVNNKLLTMFLVEKLEKSSNSQLVFYMYWILVLSLITGEQVEIPYISRLEEPLKKKLYQSLTSMVGHGQMQKFAVMFNQLDEQVDFAKEQLDFDQLTSLVAQSSLLEQNAKFMLEKFPEKTIDLWLQTSGLDYLKLIPAIVSLKSLVGEQQVSRLLLHLKNRDLDEAFQKLKCLETSDSTNLSTDNAWLLLRHLVNNHKDYLNVCETLGLYKQAIEMCLQKDSIDQAIEICKNVNDPLKAKSFWLLILKHLVKIDVERAFKLVQLTEFITFEDVFSHLPQDFVLDAELKQHITDSMNEYALNVEKKKQMVQDSSMLIKKIQAEIEQEQLKRIRVTECNICNDCKKPLTRQKFMIWTCGHALHSLCFTHLKKQQNTKCPYCFDYQIDEPFITTNSDPWKI